MLNHIIIFIKDYNLKGVFMNKKDFVNLKFFSGIYLLLKEKRANSLEAKIKEFKKRIETEKKLLSQCNHYLDNLIRDNTSIKKEYINLIKLFENENKSISIRNNNYNVSIWENISIQKISSCYVISAKKEEMALYTFNKNMNDFWDYFLTLDYSIIVLSVSKTKITLQFRINNRPN